MWMGIVREFIQALDCDYFHMHWYYTKMISLSTAWNMICFDYGRLAPICVDLQHVLDDKNSSNDGNDEFIKNEERTIGDIITTNKI